MTSLCENKYVLNHILNCLDVTIWLLFMPYIYSFQDETMRHPRTGKAAHAGARQVHGVQFEVIE